MIRGARADDASAVQALLREADELHARLLPAYFRAPKRPARTREELARLCASADETILVADEAGALAALAHVQIYDTPAIASMVPKRRAHVDSLIVTESMRRRGLGRALVEASGDWARRKGAEELLLTVWAGNEAADRFYEALGFGRVSSVLGKPL